MIEVRVLGPVSIGGTTDGKLELLHRHRKRLALFCYLAVRGGFVSRDELAAWFWPEAPEKHAKAALSQAIHVIRQYAGNSVVVSQARHGIGLNRACIWSDLEAFEAALKDRDWKGAVSHYRGDFMADLKVSDALEFSHWLDAERGRLQHAAARAALAASAESMGNDSGAALEFARRAQLIAPYDEQVLRQIMEVHFRLGDPGSAALEFERYRKRLLCDLELEPSVELQDLAGEARSRPSGSHANQSTGMPSGEIKPMPIDRAVRTAESAAVVSPVNAPGAIRSHKRTGSFRIARNAAAVGLLVVSPLAGKLLVDRERVAAGAVAHDHAPNRVAVLYFETRSAEPPHSYFADALTEALIQQLSSVEALDVVSSEGVMRFRGREASIDSAAHLLNAGVIVVGSVRQARDRLHVTMRLVDGGTRSVLDATQIERSTSDMFDVIDDVAQELAMRLRSALGEEIRLRKWQAETSSQPAWQLVERAKELEKLMAGYRRAGAREPVRKLAVRADSMLAAASDLDPKWAEPLVQRGRILHRAAWACFATSCSDTMVLGFLSQAERWSTAALGRPNAEADALEVRGAVRYSRWSMALDKPRAYGLLTAAESDLGKAVDMDPDRAGAWNTLSAVLFAEGRFEEASMAASRAFETDAFLFDQGGILTRLFNSAFHSGRDAEAAHWCREIGSRLKNLWPAAECALDLLGWSEPTGPNSVRTAWSTLHNAGNADAPMIRERMRVRLRALVAVVIARAGMPDSAKAVLHNAMQSASGDEDFAPFGAAALAALGDTSRARRVLADYVGTTPGPRQSVLRYRWFWNGISDNIAAMKYSLWPD